MSTIATARAFDTPKGTFWVADPQGPGQEIVDNPPAQNVDHKTDRPWDKIPLAGAGEGYRLPGVLVDTLVYGARSLVSAAFSGAQAAVSALSGARDWMSGYTRRPIEPERKRASQFPAPERSTVQVPGIDLGGLELKTAALDLDHDGRFCVPNVLDASLSTEDVLRKGLPFIRDTLTNAPKDPLPHTTDADRSIVRVFTEGLNTPISVAQWRLRDYVDMTGLPMAQLTNGATSDMGPLKLPFGLSIPGERRDGALQAFYRTGF
ncbi:MAG: hypothetical protein AAFQ82_22710, partial [Myxococcota bacterium]